MAKFKPGNKGRPPGSKNKNAVRSKLSDYVGSKWPTFETQMNSLKGRAYVENFIRLLPFVMPSYQSISMSLSNLPEADIEFLIDHIKQQMANED
jgi:hypothetical protein